MWTITGTLFYRAPEMFTGGGYSENVDIWAAGVLLYKLVAGRTPFESEYHNKTIDNILRKEVDFSG
jgi:calcium-dependent protein kinase